MEQHNILITPEMARLAANMKELGRILDAEAKERRRRQTLELLGDLGRDDRDILAGFAPRDVWIDDRLRDVRMAITPATAYSDIMAQLQGNTGGAALSLPMGILLGGQVAQQVSSLTLASQASGTVIWVGRVPLYSALRSIEIITDTSLGSSTLAIGDAADGNAAIYSAAATYTTTNSLTRMGPKTNYTGVELTTGYDYLGNPMTPQMPQVPSPSGGMLFEDITATVGTAALPASGTVRILISYVPAGN